MYIENIVYLQEEMKEKPSIRDAVNKIPEQEKLEIAKVRKTKHVRTFVPSPCKDVSEVSNDRTLSAIK